MGGRERKKSARVQMCGCLNTCTPEFHLPSLLLESGGAFVRVAVNVSVAIAAVLTSWLGNNYTNPLGQGLAICSIICIIFSILIILCVLNCFFQFSVFKVALQNTHIACMYGKR